MIFSKSFFEKNDHLCVIELKINDAFPISTQEVIYEKIETEDQEIQQIHNKSSSQESNLFPDVTS